MESSFLSSRSFQSTKLNLTSILYQQPLYSKCTAIARQIRENSSKELHHFFPHLLSNIFGYDLTTGWNLKSLTAAAQNDHAAVVDFLHCNGPIFELIHRLESESFVYEFPISHLPSVTQDAIHSGSIPPFFTIRDQNAIHEGFVLLNAFEYYTCHFAYYLIHARTTSQPWAQLQHSCYCLLVNQYLSYFLPPRDVIHPSQPPSSSPMRTVPSPGTTQQAKDGTSWQQCPSTPPGQSSPSSLGLLKVASPRLVQSSERESTQLWKSEVFVQILVDFWLNQSRYEFPSHFDTTQNEFRPTEEHCRIVRMMMKSIHYFANGHSAVVSPALVTLTDNFRRCIIPLYVQSRVYCFLCHALEHWPFDAVYRYVLELWLTYIQPWRYVNPDQPQQIPGNGNGNGQEIFHFKWKPFVASNLHFYINILGRVITRATQLNLRQRNDVEILSRVAKVFSQEGLNSCLLEDEYTRVTSHASFGGHSLRSSFVKHSEGSGEASGIEIVPLFTSTLDKVYTVLNVVHDAKVYAEQQLSHATGSIGQPRDVNVPSTPPPTNQQGGQTWVSGVWRWLVEEGESASSAYRPKPVSVKEMWKTISIILANTEKNLCAVFQITPTVGAEDTDGGTDGSPILPKTSIPQQQASLQPDLSSSRLEPEYEDVSLKLTPRGVNQIKSGIRKCAVKNVEYQGDPLLQPIRSYENAFLVRTFYRLSSLLNEKLSSQLMTVSSGDRFVFKLARELLAPPPPESAPPTSQHLATPTRGVSAVPLHTCSAPSHRRINLRPLASYYTLTYLTLVILLLWLLNLSLVTIAILVFLFILMYTFVMCLCRSHDKPKRH